MFIPTRELVIPTVIATNEANAETGTQLHLFFYKHNNYKHIEAEISEKSKHIVSIF